MGKKAVDKLELVVYMVTTRLSRHGVTGHALRQTPDYFRSLRIIFIDRCRQHVHRKRFNWHTINQEADAGGVFGEAGEIFGGHLAGVLTNLLGKAFCVVAADLEGDDRAEVVKDGVGCRLVQLSQILVTSNAPSSVELSSPSWPFDRFTISTCPRSMTSRRSSVRPGRLMIARMLVLVRNGRSLF